MIKKSDIDLIINDTSDLNDDMVNTVYEVLDDINPYALNITNVHTRPNTEIQREIVKIYAEALYYGVQKALSNPSVISRLRKKAEQSNKSLTFNEEAFYKKLIEEYFVNFTLFKQSKGLNQAIKYAYDIMVRSGIQPDLDTTVENVNFKIEWGTEENPDDPFFVRIEGLLDPILYEGSVKSIAHPVGFGYQYTVTKYLEFVEYVDDWVTYNVTKLKIATTIEYSFDEYDYSDRNIVDISTGKDIQNRERITVTFDNGERLLKDFDGQIYHYDKNGNIVKQWRAGYIIDLDYEMDFQFRLKDEFDTLDSESVYWEYIWSKESELEIRNFNKIGEVRVGAFSVQMGVAPTTFDIIGNPRIGKFYVNKVPKVIIGKIDHNTPYTFPGSTHKYYPEEIDDFITKAIRYNALEWMKDELTTTQTSSFDETVINDYGTIDDYIKKHLIGEVKVGEFTVEQVRGISGVVEKQKIGGFVLGDSAVFNGYDFQKLENGVLTLDDLSISKETFMPVLEEEIDLTNDQFVIREETVIKDTVIADFDAFDYRGHDVKTNLQSIKEHIVPITIGKKFKIGEMAIATFVDNDKKTIPITIGKEFKVGEVSVAGTYIYDKKNIIADGFFVDKFADLKVEFNDSTFRAKDNEFNVEKENIETEFSDNGQFKLGEYTIGGLIINNDGIGAVSEIYEPSLDISIISDEINKVQEENEILLDVIDTDNLEFDIQDEFTVEATNLKDDKTSNASNEINI